MEITGKIIAVLPVQSGTGKTGNAWSKQEYVIETAEKYPKRMCFGLWNDKIRELAIQEGESLKVFFEVDAREWQSKWFNQITAYKVERASMGHSTSENEYRVYQQENVAPEASGEVEGAEDLPF